MKRSLALGLVVASIASQAFAQEVAPAPLSERLGAVVAQARYDALSSEVRRRLDLTVSDNLASLVAATPEHCDDAFIARLRQRGGAREALVPGCGFRLPAEEAAAAIAYLIHANETDDSDFRSELRASPHVFGAALAAAQAANADGETFLTALAAGYSIQAALAAPFGPLQPRYMTSGVWGPIGAAAVSSRAYGLSGEETSAALALAASSAAGPFQYFYDQSEEKRLIVARAARNGVEAALLAGHGERGADRMLEGRAGLFNAIDAQRAASLDLEAIVATAQPLDGPLYLYPKFFAASSSIIPFLEALEPIWLERGYRGVDVENFSLAAEPAWARVLADKIVNFEAPSTEIGAKTNFAFVLALYMLRGSAAPRDFTQATLTDPAILDLARRAQFIELPQGGGSRLEIVLRSGETLIVAPYRIDPTAPAPEALELREQKFHTLSARLGARERHALWLLGVEVSEARSMSAWTRQIDALLRD